LRYHLSETLTETKQDPNEGVPPYPNVFLSNSLSERERAAPKRSVRISLYN
jgi:hypothetical protein